MDDWGGVAVAIVLVTASALGFYKWHYRGEPKPRKRVYKNKPHPVDNKFTLETLREFDGVDAKMYVGVCGKVFDVSPSENFVPEQGYGKLWAGRDATYALSKMSLDPLVANKLDYTVSELSLLEKKSLKSWIAHFSTKYEEVGTLKEYEDFDFSGLENLPSENEDEDPEEAETTCTDGEAPTSPVVAAGKPSTTKSAIQEELDSMRDTVKEIEREAEHDSEPTTHSDVE